MRILFDTNVLIAAFISRGACSELFEHCAARHRVIGSQFILDELREHLAGKFKFAAQDVEQVVALLESAIDLVPPSDLGERICRDASDDVILATAAAGNADCIVTGDEDLLVLREFRGIPILRPGQFSDFEARSR
jgi:putative PIN family toxin of toxin-antitoxin system